MNVFTEVLQVTAEAAIDALEEVAPENVIKALKTQADLINLFPVGSERNYAFPAAQLNISATQKDGQVAGEFTSPELY